MSIYICKLCFGMGFFNSGNNVGLEETPPREERQLWTDYRTTDSDAACCSVRGIEKVFRRNLG